MSVLLKSTLPQLMEIFYDIGKFRSLSQINRKQYDFSLLYELEGKKYAIAHRGMYVINYIKNYYIFCTIKKIQQDGETGLSGSGIFPYCRKKPRASGMSIN